MGGGDFSDEIVKLTVMAIKNGFWHLDGAEGMNPSRTRTAQAPRPVHLTGALVSL